MLYQPGMSGLCLSWSRCYYPVYVYCWVHLLIIFGDFCVYIYYWYWSVIFFLWYLSQVFVLVLSWHKIRWKVFLSLISDRDIIKFIFFKSWVKFSLKLSEPGVFFVKRIYSFKDNTLPQIEFLYHSKQNEILKKKVLFIKNIKYPGINLAKRMPDHYLKMTQCLLREAREYLNK